MKASPARRPRSPTLVLLYALSLPERVLRTLLGWLGRLVLLVSNLLPRVLRSTRFYKVAVTKQLRLLSEGIGGADASPEGSDSQDAPVGSDDLPRKIIGGTIDNLAILTMHFSPVWVLLALSDVIKGAGSVTEELLAELGKEGLIPAGSKIHNLDDFLSALARVPGEVAESMDRPPLSIAKLRETLESIRADARNVDLSSVVGPEDLRQLLTTLRSTSKREKRSLLHASTEVGLVALTRAGALTRDVSLAAFTGAKVGGRILFRELVQSYFDSARDVQRKGLFKSLHDSLRPQTHATARTFDGRFLTLTELALSGGRLGRAPWRIT